MCARNNKQENGKLFFPENLSSKEYEYSGDRKALAFFRKVPGANWLCKKYLNFLLKFHLGQLLGSAIKVSEKQFPDIDVLVAKASQILGIERPPLYLLESPEVNAYTFGTDEKNVYIIITRGLLDAVRGKKMMFILGHEMGHIKSQHVFYHTLAQWLCNAGIWTLVNVPVLSEMKDLVTLPIQIALLAWQRRSEITADRAGLICCQDLELAQRAMAVLTLGSSELADKVDIKSLENQYDKSQVDYGRWSEILLTHPYFPKRLKAIRLFKDSHFYSRRVQQKSDTKFITMEDLDASVARILGDKEPGRRSWMQESNDVRRLKIVMAFAGAWEQGKLSDKGKTTIENLMEEMALDKGLKKKLSKFYKQPLDQKTAEKELKYFKNNKIVGIPYLFSLLMIDRRKIRWIQTPFLEEIVVECGLSKEETKKIVSDAAYRKRFFREKCGVDLCTNCCMAYPADLPQCPDCSVLSSSLVKLTEDQERRVCTKCGLTFNTKDYSACPKCGNQDVLVYQSAVPVK